MGFFDFLASALRPDSAFGRIMTKAYRIDNPREREEERYYSYKPYEYVYYNFIPTRLTYRDRQPEKSYYAKYFEWILLVAAEHKCRGNAEDYARLFHDHPMFRIYANQEEDWPWIRTGGMKYHFYLHQAKIDDELNDIQYKGFSSDEVERYWRFFEEILNAIDSWEEKPTATGDKIERYGKVGALW